jgi:hypothetical protein
LNHFCEKIFIEEHELSLKHVEKNVKTPFGRKPLDLSIYTFDEHFDDNFFDDNVNTKIFGDITKVESKFFIEDEWKHVGGNSLSEQKSFVLGDGENERDLKKRGKHRRRLRKRKNKLERGRSKMTRRLSSTKSPLKRTHWNDGKRARGFRPREIKVWILTL